MIVLLACGGWLLGLYLGAHFALPWVSALLLAAALGSLTLLLGGHRRQAAPLLLLGLALLFGLMRGGPPDRIPGDLHLFNDQTMTVRGVIGDDPEPAGRFLRFRFSARERWTDSTWVPLSGDAMVWAQPRVSQREGRPVSALHYGDRVELQGRGQEPPTFADFNYQAYLARQGIGSTFIGPEVTVLDAGHGNPLLSWIYGVRRRLGPALDGSLPEPQASLSRALLLGQRGNLTQDVEQAFRDSGTSHVLAISGLHVGVVLGLTLVVAQWALGRRRQLYVLLPLGAIWLYALLSGLSPSVTRAAIMGSIYLAALALGRQRDALAALALTAAIMAGLNPRLLWDLSFQLSFTAMAGLLLLSPLFLRWSEPLLQRAVGRHPGAVPWLRFVMASVAATLAATIATAPLLAFNFHRLSLVGIPATLLILPVLPGVLVGSLGAAVLGLASSALAQLVAWVPWLLEGYIVGVVQLFAGLPGAAFDVGSPAPALVGGYYGVLAFLLLLGRRQRWLPAAGHLLEVASRPPSRPAMRVGTLLVVGAVATLLWSGGLAQPDGRLHVWFLDVGQGDAILIRTPRGLNILVDGGSDSRVTLRELDRHLPFWDRDIDLAILSHPHDDHLNGLVEVARRGRIQRVLEPAADGEVSPTYARWREVLETEKIPRQEAYEGQRVQTPGGVVLDVLAPPRPAMGGTTSDIDNNSVVLRLLYGDVAVLLTGDMRREAESSLLDRGVRVAVPVLKVAHHGSDTSSTEEFLGKVSPVLAIISMGADNPHGHPSAEVVARLKKRLGPGRLLSTARHGTIEIHSDGTRLRVRTER